MNNIIQTEYVIVRNAYIYLYTFMPITAISEKEAMDFEKKNRALYLVYARVWRVESKGRDHVIIL